MKKKIIYFCAGVLLTSLILVAIQVVATAPNPGHEISDIGGDLGDMPLGGKTFLSWIGKPLVGAYEGIHVCTTKPTRTTTCTSICEGLGLYCIGTYSDSAPACDSGSNYGCDSISYETTKVCGCGTPINQPAYI